MTVQEWLGKDNTIGIDAWSKKYPYENETYDEWLNRIGKDNESLKKLIRELKFLFGGRILSNRGLHNKGIKVTYSNCYVMSPPEDNIESIFDCAKYLARTYSYGGGCGVDISKLAPKGAKVANTAKNTSGAVSFMDLYSLTTGLIGQNGRRGALMISIDCSHPDIEDFINIKSDLNKITKANISIKITDEFMTAVRKNDDYTLHFTRPESNETIKTVVKARELFNKIILMNWDYAEPGFLFWDEIKRWNMLSNNKEFEYAGVNPCVSGDTLILTEEGYIRIDSLVDKEINVWNGYEFSTVTPKVTGINQQMKRITFSDGNQLDCTNYHKFILKDGTRVEAKNLQINDKLIKCNFPIITTGMSISPSLSYTQGFFMGDGSSETNRNRLSIKLYDKKRNVINRLMYDNINYCESFHGDFLTLPYQPELFNKNYVPSIDYNISSRLNWLAGYLDSDGTLQSADGGLSISSVNKDVLMKVKFLLNTMGCNGTVRVMREAGTRLLPKNDGTRDSATYLCQTSYRLIINATNVKKLMDMGLNTSRIPLIANPNRDATRFIKIISIEDIDDCDKVYCFNEPKNHSGIFNGIITAQCAEEPLPAGGSCLLGSINLSEFVKNPFTEDAQFNIPEFLKAVDTGVIALNEILDEGLPLHPLQEQKDSVRDWRQIGLGVFGLADMLIKLGLKYGSEESIDVCDNIGYNMASQAILSSALLAKKFGAYPKCDKEKVIETSFFQAHATPETIELVRTYGLRNSQLLTIAPTGTLSTMIGVSGGVEPIFANYYNRKTESLHGKDVTYKIYTPIVEQYMKKHKINDDKDLPDYFITSQDISYYNRIDMQSIWQEHIDASISSTINLQESTTVEDVSSLYMYAWEKNLKGITIFRDGCKRLGILTFDEEVGKETLARGQIINVNDNVIGKKRKLVTGCGSLHCTAFFDPINGNLLETYLSKGSTGGCQNFMVGLSRMISYSARIGGNIYDIVDQLNSCGSCPSYAVRAATKKDTSKGSCCPIAISNALLDMYNQVLDELGLVSEKKLDSAEVKKLNTCPECGETLINESGCITCKFCGYSKCS